ncbi:MAG: Holliday junction resolvase [Desulfurococcaceae archaeon]|jgi:Holliday junction resolvase|nr:Holliday junction resolvase [Desulfurococcaceae archaeon]
MCLKVNIALRFCIGCVVLSSRRVRGFSHERELARRLWSHGLAVMRAPASGSKVKRLVYPDIVAIYKGRVLVFEVKTTSSLRDIYIPRRQVEKLVEFTRRAGGEAYIAVKITGTGEWLFVNIDKLLKTSSGNYKLPRNMLGEALKLAALVSLVKGVKDLFEFTNSKSEST